MEPTAIINGVEVQIPVDDPSFGYLTKALCADMAKGWTYQGEPLDTMVGEFTILKCAIEAFAYWTLKARSQQNFAADLCSQGKYEGSLAEGAFAVAAEYDVFAKAWAKAGKLEKYLFMNAKEEKIK